MAILEIARIQVRRGQENQTGMPQLEPGEFGWAEDTENLYIGKRIAEGAVDDNNTRILTQHDLDNIFSLVGSSVAEATPYTYRKNVPYINYTTSVTLQEKLDEEVSLVSFGVTPSVDPVDITVPLQNAISDLFLNSTWDSYERKDTRRCLKIPAGNYYITETIELPPFAKLVGEGRDLTTLTLMVDNTGMFKTVDADGDDYLSGNMNSGVKRCRDVHLEGMTIEYSSSYVTNHPLLSLDNVLDANVVDCIFRTEINPLSTTTYGLIGAGIGIQIRGTGSGLGSGDSNLCENVQIQNCIFDSLNKAVEAQGSIIRPVVENSVFSNLFHGIRMLQTDSTPGPSNGYFLSNRFENIVQGGIYVSTATIRTNHVSESNLFVQVGNGVQLDDTVSTKQYPVISFLSEGNKTINDYFERKHVANLAPLSSAPSAFYYNPLVNGSTTIVDAATYTATVFMNTLTSVTKFFLNNNEQTINVNYQLTNSSLSRKGKLSINVTPGNDIYPVDAQLLDNYTYMESMYVVQTGLPNLGYPTQFTTQFAVDAAVYPIFNTVNPGTGTWYLTGNNLYHGKSAQITSIAGTDGNIIIFNTTSANPEFNFTVSNETYSLIRPESQDPTFNVSTQYADSKNYIVLTCYSGSTATNSLFEYQVETIS